VGCGGSKRFEKKDQNGVSCKFRGGSKIPGKGKQKISQTGVKREGPAGGRRGGNPRFGKKKRGQKKCWVYQNGNDRKDLGAYGVEEWVGGGKMCGQKRHAFFQSWCEVGSKIALAAGSQSKQGGFTANTRKRMNKRVGEKAQSSHFEGPNERNTAGGVRATFSGQLGAWVKSGSGGGVFLYGVAVREPKQPWKGRSSLGSSGQKANQG